MEERARRIVDTAIELAEEGGFEAVRLRDVASHAGVALGTLYRRFRSKEDLLVAALEIETRDLQRRFLQRPPKGADALERVTQLFGLATRGLLRRPNLARALIRAASAGTPELAQKVAGFHERVEWMIVGAMRGEPLPLPGEPYVEELDERERRVAYSLNMIWFALLVGWSGGLHGQHVIVEKIRASAELLLAGSSGGSAPPRS